MVHQKISRSLPRTGVLISLGHATTSVFVQVYISEVSTLFLLLPRQTELRITQTCNRSPIAVGVTPIFV